MGVDYKKLFSEKSVFQQILFLDNFHEEVAISEIEEGELYKLIELFLKSNNEYIIRAGFILLCDLTLSGRLANVYFVLGELHKLLEMVNVSLQSLAIKYLPYFEESRSDILIEKLKVLSDNDNADVASQSYFCLGLFALTEAVASDNKADLLMRIYNAKTHFIASNSSQQNRVDAEFYLIVIDWLSDLFSSDKQSVEASFNKIKVNLLVRKTYGFGENEIELDFIVFQLLEQMQRSYLTSNRSHGWIEVRDEVNILFNAFQEIRILHNNNSIHKSLTSSLFSNVFEKVESHLYQLNLLSKRRVFENLSKETPESPLGDFLQYILSSLAENKIIEEENNELLTLLVEAKGSEKGLLKYNLLKDKTVSKEVISQLRIFIKKYKNQQFPYKTGSIIGQEVYYNLRKNIEQKLINYSENKLEAYFNVLEEVIRYARTTFVKNNRNRFPFLYSKINFDKGKGQDAKEEDLQTSMWEFLEHSKIADGLDNEKTRFVDGGRVDIVYSKDLITVPIELKKSLNRPAKKDIETNYIAQAQTYTAGYDQLGIFVLLELSDKTKEPPPNFKDWFKIHHLKPSSDIEIEFPDYVISVIIPGNRTSPSSKSNYV